MQQRRLLIKLLFEFQCQLQYQLIHHDPIHQIYKCLLVFCLDASKGIEDYSKDPCILTNNGVTIENDYFVFNGNNYITTNYSNKLNFSSGDFTIDIIMNLSTENEGRAYPSILSGKDGWNYGANGLRWHGTHRRNGFAVFLNPGDPLFSSNTSFTPNNDTFIKYTVQRRSGLWEQYFDEVKDSTTVNNSQEFDLYHTTGMSIGCSLWDRI